MAADFRRLVEDSRVMTRRSFLAIAGWVGFTAASAIALFQSVKFIQPNATYEDPPAFKPVGDLAFPANYAVGSTTVLIDKRVVINRDQDGFYAISLICTHLGCTPRYFPDVTSDLVLAGTQISKDPDTGQLATKANPALPGFKCPCHGSRYFRDADNFFGPAPRPMDRVHMELAKDGRLFVDRSVIVDHKFRLKV
ncbi:MAG: ubiquinol-cytochrome c reductase iron-sulfur subunit [Chloroflexi bacterium]|nr:MAG: ubiquinol-cytochrome c reductase iron-sulfur subunit [Chloroflexota bacterium]TMF47453.1 MAG: ubiquinol-cytochrome c reductase iron-sulfur subunit [Chloroflexota bacterium]TMG11162.1 MAG: ubiquinol-cytochrome c reductase iron-sulfur subunit [Chloroflexota bacterium]TMG17196.1 MAG: ubiquinol-cytochrome c reductase iron-sulfur subunit [Chloroflexota bacterium]TMG48446.1 MAG: ubiquinol-cytochrome c reductase iron-sulfur subunit [Chloroflexota bacterium]